MPNITSLAKLIFLITKLGSQTAKFYTLGEINILNNKISVPNCQMIRPGEIIVVSKIDSEKSTKFYALSEVILSFTRKSVKKFYIFRLGRNYYVIYNKIWAVHSYSVQCMPYLSRGQ